MRIFTFLIILLPCLPVLGQQITVSDEFPLRSDIGYEIIGELNGRVLLFRDKTVTFEVQAFDANMRSSWEKEVELLKRSPEVLGINTVNDLFTIIYRHRQRGNTVIRAQRYDSNVRLRDSTVVIDLGYLFFTPDFEVLRSQDRSKVLIYYIDNQKEVRAFVFDNNKMELLWDYSFEPEDFRSSEDILHMVVSNDGDMYAAIEKDNYRIRKKDHRYEIFKFGHVDRSIVLHEVYIPEYYTYDLYFTFDNLNDKLVAGGFYYEKNPARTEGYFFLSMPEDCNRHDLKFHSFPDDFVEGLLGKEMKKNKGLEEVTIQDVVPRTDGGIVIIAEENKNYQRRLSSTNRMVYDAFARNVTDFYYNDIFALSLNPDGSDHWQKIMHKKQYSQDDAGAYSSYFLFKNPRNLRIIFNDEIKFENTVSEYVLRGTGDFNRNSILSTENQKLRLRFRDAIQISPEKMLVPSEHRGRLRIAKLELQ